MKSNLVPTESLHHFRDFSYRFHRHLVLASRKKHPLARSLINDLLFWKCSSKVGCSFVDGCWFVGSQAVRNRLIRSNTEMNERKKIPLRRIIRKEIVNYSNYGVDEINCSIIASSIGPTILCCTVPSEVMM